MGRNALAAAYDMDGAFNNVSLTLTPGAEAQAVIDRLDGLLARYGGIGAFARKDQFSNRFLSEELKQLQTTATVFPSIFLGVAAFLLNVVVARLIATQREQIAVLKAFGYRPLAIGWHYLKLVLTVAFLGVAGGVALGAWFGQGLAGRLHGVVPLPLLALRAESGRHRHRPRGGGTGGGQRHAGGGGSGGAPAAGGRHASGNARGLSCHPARAAGPATAAEPADAHDPAPHRAAAAEIAAHRVRHRLRRRPHDGGQLPAWRHRFHGGHPVPSGGARR